MNGGSRRIITCIITGLVGIFFEVSAQQNVTLKLKNVDFFELKEVIEQNFICNFSFAPEDVEGTNFTIEKSEYTLPEILDKCERQSKLHFKLNKKRNRINVTLKKVIDYKGAVYEENSKNPLPGALLRSRISTSGTVTDREGRFNISSTIGDTVDVSFMGYYSSNIVIGDNLNEKIVYLTPSPRNLEEVVVVAYGEQPKKAIKGSIGKVTSKELIKFNASSFEHVLQGRVSGLQILSSGGESTAPTRMLIRGVNSISAGVNPLIIMDGTPLINEQSGLERSEFSNPQNPLSLINLNDIASIEILKDAASSTLYGSRASNGIILITTKSGEQGYEGFEFSYNTSISSRLNPAKKLGLANTATWFEIVDQARSNSGLGIFNPETLINAFPFTDKEFISRQEALNTQIDWFEEILRNGISQDYQLSYRDNNDKNNFYISGNYRTERGALLGDNFQRFAIRSNIDIKPNHNFTAKIRSSLSYTDKNRPINLSESLFNEELKGGFSQVITNALPWFPIFSESDITGYWNPLSGANAVASNDENLFFDNVKQFRYTGSSFVNYDVSFIDGLSFKGLVGLDLIINDNSFFVSQFLRDGQSLAYEQNVNASLLNYNAFAEYKKHLGDHKISLLGGIEAQRNRRNLNLVGAEGALNNNGQIDFNNNITFSQNGLVQERYLFSYLGRMNYQFEDKFFAEASYRLDGTSAFLPANRWSSFKAFSMAWIITQESFFDLSSINHLKLRASYGETGNQEVDDNLFVTNYRNDRRYGDLDLITGGTSIQSLGARDLSWENSNSFDLGLEYGIFDNKYFGSITYFQQQVSDLLLQVPLPLSATIDDSSPEIWDNTGSITNNGFEIDLGINLIKNSSFRWDINLNYTHVNNKVNNLYADVDSKGNGINSRNITLTKSGGKLGGYFLASYAGVDEEKGVEMIHEIDLELFNQTGNTVKTGNLIPATQQNIIDHKVYNSEKSGIPTFYGGINSTLHFKQFSIDMLWNFVGGHYLFDYSYHIAHYPGSGSKNLKTALINNSWSTIGDNAPLPELKWDYFYDWNMVNGTWVAETTNYNNTRFFTDRFLQKGDFLRLRNLRINYSFNENQLRKIKFNSLDVHCSVQNLLTFTKYKGLDPEAVTVTFDESINNLSSGLIRNTPLPNLLTFNFGITASF